MTTVACMMNGILISMKRKKKYGHLLELQACLQGCWCPITGISVGSFYQKIAKFGRSLKSTNATKRIYFSITHKICYLLCVTSCDSVVFLCVIVCNSPSSLSICLHSCNDYYGHNICYLQLQKTNKMCNIMI